MPCIPALPMAALSTHCATGTGTAIFYVGRRTFRQGITTEGRNIPGEVSK